VSPVLEQIGRQRREHSSRMATKRRRAIHDMYSGELRELYRLRGHDLDDPDTLRKVNELVERGIAPIGGGATGKGAASFFLNMPPEGTYVPNIPYFNQETERNDVPQQPFPYTGLGGGRMDQRVQNVGILSFIRLFFVGTLTVAGAGTVTGLYGFPWNLAKRITVQANGQTSLMQAEGADFRARRNRLFRNPAEQICSTGGASQAVIPNGTYTIVAMYDLPIVHDMTTLTGALFAQSDTNYLSYTIEPALQADMFTAAGGSTVTLTGNFFPQLTYFDIPYIDAQSGRLVAIPDLRWLHGFIASNLPFANTGDVITPLIKNAGQLIAFYAYLDNGGAAVINWLSAVDQFRVEYGGNRKPLVWSGPAGQGAVFGLEENERNYNGLIQGGTTAAAAALGPGPFYLVLDLENDNPDRDLIYPRGVTELQAVAKITQGTTINANAHVHFVEETLFSGA
jgi:hypothetical protein